MATGHYARLDRVDGKVQLLRAADQSKDQTYFLNQVTTKQLENVIFPLSGMMKSEVRELAEQNGLVTAGKKD